MKLFRRKMGEIAGMMNGLKSGKEEPFVLPKSSYVSMIKDFDKKLIHTIRGVGYVLKLDSSSE